MDGISTYDQMQRNRKDRLSRVMLSRVQENDPTLTEFQIGGKGFDSDMNMIRPSDSSYESAFCRLGGCIAENTHLIQLDIYLCDGILLHTTDRGFYDGLLRNSSIKTLRLLCPPNTNIIGGVEQEILTAYHANNHLTQLTLISIDMQNGRDLFTTTLRCSPNLKQLELLECNITDELLLQLIESVRECALEKLGLTTNRIGNTGCDILAALLEDPKCNIHTLDLNNNQIGNEGAITLANSLINNNKLKDLRLKANPITNETGEVLKAFQRLLCYASAFKYGENRHSSINDTYNSNHTLEKLNLPSIYSEIGFFLQLNTGENKTSVAINKIVCYHELLPDLESMFEWDSSEERTLKGLPYLIKWYEKADTAVAGIVNQMSTDPGRRWRQPVIQAHLFRFGLNVRLSAMYQFARSMPLLFEPISRMEVEEND